MYQLSSGTIEPLSFSLLSRHEKMIGFGGVQEELPSLPILLYIANEASFSLDSVGVIEDMVLRAFPKIILSIAVLSRTLFIGRNRDGCSFCSFYSNERRMSRRKRNDRLSFEECLCFLAILQKET